MHIPQTYHLSQYLCLLVQRLFQRLFRLLRKKLGLANHSFFGFGFQGGAGGKGNVSFKSSTCQTPQVAEAGGVGEEFTFDIGNVDDRQAVPKINIGIRTETELGRGSKAQA